MITILLFVSVGVLTIILRRLIRESRAHKLPPQYPGKLPLLGHLHLSLKTNNGKQAYETLYSIAEDCVKQGGVNCVEFGTQLYYGITDHADMQTTSNICTDKHFAFRFAKSWLGDGLITSSGETWKRHHRLLLSAFSARVTNEYLGIFNEHSKQLLEDIAPLVNKGPFNQATYIGHWALETFCNSAFGLEGYEDKEFIKKYMKFVDVILQIISYRFQKFWLHSDFIYKFSGIKKTEDEVTATLRHMSNAVIRRKRTKLIENKMNGCDKDKQDTKYKPFLDLLLEISGDDQLSDKEIREEVDTAIVASFDTITATMTFITMALGEHQDVQDRLYDEIIQVIGSDRDVEKLDLNELVYTEAVIKETLRVYSVIPALLRQVDRDVKLKNCIMRAGSYCALLLCGTHKDPAKWGADVNEFRPERWMESATETDAFVGFGIGKRACPGKIYAMMSIKVMVAHFIRKYRILRNDHSKLVLGIGVVMKPEKGHEISIALRN